MHYNEYEIKKEMCEIGKRVYHRGMVAANDGNFSVKLSDDAFLCTPTGVSKGFMTPEQICKVDKNGDLIQSNGEYKPSSEIKMHMRVYQERKDVGAIVHAHPLYATTFAIAGIPLKRPILPEAVMTLGWVPIAKYATPSTPQVPESIIEHLQFHDAVLLANHGALTYSDTLLNAYHKMETVEFYAQILYQTQMLGNAQELSKDEVERIYEMRRQSGLPGRHPANTCPNVKQGRASCHDYFNGGNTYPFPGDNELISSIVEKVLEQLR